MSGTMVTEKIILKNLGVHTVPDIPWCNLYWKQVSCRKPDKANNKTSERSQGSEIRGIVNISRFNVIE